MYSGRRLPGRGIAAARETGDPFCREPQPGRHLAPNCCPLPLTGCPLLPGEPYRQRGWPAALGELASSPLRAPAAVRMETCWRIELLGGLCARRGEQEL